MDTMKLQGKRALVTGSVQGIGLAIYSLQVDFFAFTYEDCHLAHEFDLLAAC